MKTQFDVGDVFNYFWQQHSKYVTIHWVSDSNQLITQQQPRQQNIFREKSQECDCCWSVGCLCPMPNQVQKIASSFTREVDQNIGFLNANLGSTNDKVEDDWKKKIKDLRWSEIFLRINFFCQVKFFWKFLTMIFRWRKKKILDTARKNMVEGKCLKCNHRAPKCDKARRRA